MKTKFNTITTKWLRSIAVFSLVLNSFSAFAQLTGIQPLSRDDKAKIALYEKEFEEASAKESWNQASEFLNKIAFLHWEHNDYQKAIDYYEQSLELNTKVSNENGLAMLHNNLGMLYEDIQDHEKALEYFEKTLAARRAGNSKEGMIAALKNISISLRNLGRTEDSIKALDEALSNARELGNLEEIASCYLMISEAYQKDGNVEKTAEFFQLYRTFADEKAEIFEKEMLQKISAEELKARIAELKVEEKEAELNLIQDELDKKNEKFDEYDEKLVAATKELTETEKELKIVQVTSERNRLRDEAEIRKQKALSNSLLIGAVGLLGILFFIYRNYKNEQRSKKILAEKNEKINAQNDELVSLNKIIAKHNKRMQTELDVGREIQMSMIPRQFPEVQGVDLFAALVPALEVGGDLYDFFRLDDDHLMFGIGDVSDKGVPAALFMAVTKTLVKTNANYSQLPGKILTQVNRELSQDNEKSMFVTYFLSVLNTKTGKLTYCNAGHNPPLYLSKDGDLSKRGMLNKLDTIHGPVLGAVDDFEYQQDTLMMKKGEQLVLFTDGVTEAMNVDKMQYSNERLDDLLSGNGKHDSKQSVEEIIADVKKFRGDADQSDDLTIMSLIYTGQ